MNKWEDTKRLKQLKTLVTKVQMDVWSRKNRGEVVSEAQEIAKAIQEHFKPILDELKETKD